LASIGFVSIALFRFPFVALGTTSWDEIMIDSFDAQACQTDIVIVHPPDVSREMYRSVLSQMGYSTVAFDDVSGFQQWFESRQHGATALILELLPSPEDAWALIRELRIKEPGIALIILTSVVRPDRVNRRRAQAVGVAAFVGKPCGLRQLVDVVIRVTRGERGIEMIHYTEPE
jgi:DNA-binding response OmpR family regulator